ncbi:MAG: response regulator [Phycisphaeraceae bacterium]|nr:response regulator [Phycisphaeraceae bacterium]
MKPRVESTQRQAAGDSSPPHRPFHILLVDGDPSVRDLLSQISDGEHLTFGVAATLVEARRFMDEQTTDLVLIEPNLSDASGATGMTLAQELSDQRSDVTTIVVTGRPSLERAIESIRLGVADFIVKPMNLNDLNQAVKRAMGRRTRQNRHQRRLKRLRRMCADLTQSHQEVTKQVDVLCNDLVTAYQELATQMHQVVTSGEYGRKIGNELDLEQVLRKTLEFLLDHAGPTNAAVFLPSTADEFTLGGYINYDCTRQCADMILQHLADIVAPKVAARDEMVHITKNADLEAWIGADAAYLADSDVLAFAARHDKTVMAVLVLFRDHGQPYSHDLVEVCNALGPALGSQLHRVIRIHHRCMPEAPAAGDGEEPAFGF